ncbi:hypothetical protein [Pelagibius sp. Alg239-R121]|uniref:hypothetical protein n=1 Tax=Pelagibius sp. Alg239-R121 TaxID=2993448 RepID=UPI0024A66F7B|nr:hypothetical protein [Pelagibius sp. Alg239-R121]
MASFMIAVGGTGQMMALSYARLMSLMPWLPTARMYHLDRDTIEHYTDSVDSTFIDPLPQGAGATVGTHFTEPSNREFCENVLDALFTAREQSTPVGQGMYGRPPVGAAMIVDSLSRPASGSFDELFDGSPESTNAYLRDGMTHTVIVCGSAMGGTGAGGVPTIAHEINRALKSTSHRDNVKLYILYFLQHFSLRPVAVDQGMADHEIIHNEQIAVNAKSGMSFLADKIVDGTNGCVLFGLGVPPSRTHEAVGKQTEQSEPLHVLAAAYAQSLFDGGRLARLHNAHAIEVVQMPQGRKVATDLGIGIALGEGRSVSLERVIQLNVAVARYLSRLSRLFDGGLGFAFVPPMPKDIEKILTRLTRLTKNRRETIQRAVSTKLTEEAQRIHTTVRRYEALTKDIVPFSIDLQCELDGDGYQQSLHRPMAFIRAATRGLRNLEAEQLDYDTVSDAIVSALFRSLDNRYFNGEFGLAGEH